MKPGDIVLWRDRRYGRHRFWEIKGVFLGAEGQESLVELQSLTERPGHAYLTREFPTTFVPEPFLREATIYTPDIGACASPGAL